MASEEEEETEGPKKTTKRMTSQKIVNGRDITFGVVGILAMCTLAVLFFFAGTEHHKRQQFEHEVARQASGPSAPPAPPASRVPPAPSPSVTVPTRRRRRTPVHRATPSKATRTAEETDREMPESSTEIMEEATTVKSAMLDTGIHSEEVSGTTQNTMTEGAETGSPEARNATLDTSTRSEEVKATMEITIREGAEDSSTKTKNVTLDTSTNSGKENTVREGAETGSSETKNATLAVRRQ